MPLVTGSARMFSQSAFPESREFELVFTPSGPASGVQATYWGPPITVKPAADATFSVNLVSTENLVPDTWFEPSARWLDGSGNFVGVNFPGWKIRVPGNGGDIRELMQIPADSTMIWFGNRPPEDRKRYAGWVDTSTVLPDATMPYYEWE